MQHQAGAASFHLCSTLLGLGRAQPEERVPGAAEVGDSLLAQCQGLAHGALYLLDSERRQSGSTHGSRVLYAVSRSSKSQCNRFKLWDRDCLSSINSVAATINPTGEGEDLEEESSDMDEDEAICGRAFLDMEFGMACSAEGSLAGMMTSCELLHGQESNCSSRVQVLHPSLPFPFCAAPDPASHALYVILKSCLPYVPRSCSLPASLQLPDPASGASAPFDVLLITYTMFERDSMDARVDRALIKKWVAHALCKPCK
eukprot:1147595-Pelagomonas_calceolata.AAC.6